MSLEQANATYQQFIRGDALIGIMPDAAAQERTMVERFWEATATTPEAFQFLGDLHRNRVQPVGAFDGIDPELSEGRPFSPKAQQITVPDQPAIEAALRCYAEGALRGHRGCMLRLAQVSRQGGEAAQQLATELLSALPDRTAAETYRLALLHHWQSQLSRAADLHHQAAEQGDLDAQFELYIYYAQGIGVAVDHDASQAWLGRAAAGGHPRAVFNLGAIAALDEDYATAAKHYTVAANAGNPRAAATLGVMILLEQLPGTEEEAIRWLNLCDDLGGDSLGALWGAGLEDPRGEADGGEDSAPW